MFWLMRNGGRAGPYTLDQLRVFVGAGQAVPTDHVWYEGAGAWQPLSAVFAMQQAPQAEYRATAFGGYFSCSCGCRAFSSGSGDMCANCGHSYKSHG